MITENLQPIEAWIVRTTLEATTHGNNYDKLCELVVCSYSLSYRTRKMDHVDRITYFCTWWNANKKLMSKYKTLESIGNLLGGRDHASIIHHKDAFNKEKKGRKVSYQYDENVADIKDFLES